jgi:hypothetical protein
LTSSSLPPRAAARHCDLPNLRELLAAREHAHEQAFRGASGGYVTHRSTGDPDYLASHNEDPKPFVWTASIDAILEKIGRCHAVRETAHYEPRVRARRGTVARRRAHLD